MKQIGKKLTSLFAAVLLSGNLAAAMPVNAADAPLPGDCDLDGQLTVADVCMLQDIITCRSSVCEQADFNADGSINGLDLTLLKRAVLYPPIEETPETATVLVYQCGSNLESESMQASLDLLEMLSAEISDNIHIVIETGGSKRWFNGISDAQHNYRIAFDNENLDTQQVSDKARNMGDSDTLASFISESVAAYPADRYGLVLWNHGSGPIYGCCADELTDDSLLLPELCEGLEKGGVHFDWIGFDCCVMATAEIAFAIRNYADYMVASEESESQYGWEYSGFLSALSQNMSISTADLVTKIVDDMVDYNHKMRSPATLSAFDLTKAEPMMQAIYSYVGDVYNTSKSNMWSVKSARSQCLDYGEGQFDIVDLGDLVQKLQMPHSQDVLNAMNEMVIHSKEYDVAGATGLALWFFENFPEDCYYLDYVFGSVGIDKTYINQMTEMAKSQVKPTWRLQSRDDLAILAMQKQVPI